MSKAILVVDMPEKCFGCPCNSFNPQAKRWECDAATLTRGRIGVIKLEEKPDWCPLRPLPKKMKRRATDEATDLIYSTGWNDCLAEMMGETEMSEEQLEEMFKYIEAVPNVPEDDRTNKYQAPCPCGGTITAWRVKANGHLRARCNTCEFKLVE